MAGESNTNARKELRIVYIQYTNPTGYPPIEHSASIFGVAGWRVTFLGIHAEGDADSFQFGADTQVDKKLLRRWEDRRFLKLHFCAFVFWCWANVFLRRPHLVWLSDRMACPVGALLALTTSIPIIYQEHDGPPAVRNRIEKFLNSTRTLVSTHSRFCIFPNRARAEAFRTEIPDAGQTLTVMNCPSMPEINNIGERQHPTDRLRLYYHGSLVPARLPLTILAALHQLPDSFELDIVGFETNGAAGYIAHFLEQAAALGLQSRVRFEGAFTDRELLLRRCAQSDVGLALLPLQTDDLNERTMAGATNKVFDYLACGIPVLVPELPDQVQLFVDNGVALACDPGQPDSIAAALDWFFKHPDETRTMGERGRARVLNDWNYENQFRPVLDAIRS
jgi:glycosyltransferase involved in cell wall biosynthesis